MPASVGDIFRFKSKKTAGRDSRNKFHVAIELSKGAMLFINSDPFEGAMKITRTDWPEMPNEESYISCSGIIRYSKSDLKDIRIKPRGGLSDDCLTRLRDHVESSLTLPQNDIDVILEALEPFRDD